MQNATKEQNEEYKIAKASVNAVLRHFKKNPHASRMKIYAEVAADFDVSVNTIRTRLANWEKYGDEALVPKIIEHMKNKPYVDSRGATYAYGEFFPIEFSQIGYNNTIAIQHFPLTKTEAEKKLAKEEQAKDGKKSKAGRPKKDDEPFLNYFSRKKGDKK